MSEIWIKWTRPGYFGRRRDEKITALNRQHGEGGWKLGWVIPPPADTNIQGEIFLSFEEACRVCYEEAYFQHFKDRTDDLNFATSFGECYDNAKTNIDSGCDYTKQEAFSTHIQDIALRNVLKRLGREFKGPKDLLLQIRSADTAGYRFGPGNVPFHTPQIIYQPSLAPSWAKPGSVEDFWQSNKWVLVKRDSAINSDIYPV